MNLYFEFEKYLKIQKLEEKFKKEKFPLKKYHLWEEIKNVKEESNEYNNIFIDNLFCNNNKFIHT